MLYEKSFIQVNYIKQQKAETSDCLLDNQQII